MNFKNFTLNGISVFLGLIFFTAGMGKLFFEHRYPGLIGPVWLEERLATFWLGLFARFIAYTQVLVGFVLLTLRYRTLGAIMLLPLLLNILVVTISLHWRGTPYVLAFLLGLNLVLLLAEAPKLLHLLGFRTAYRPPVAAPSPATYGLVWLAGLAVMLASIPVSAYLPAAGYLLSILGPGIGLATYLKGGRAGEQPASPATPSPI
ncbi:hypothetical protein [Pontibacter liquoris]|uniref:hypothetical protein n=1 Tax=Pontibacter liquoris TaxID=2905677 RepID=UPI001FA755C4|nr:hypothetical protein [Pontibacter liquoris]